MTKSKYDYYDMMHTEHKSKIKQVLAERYGKWETESTFKKPYIDEYEYPEMEDFYYDIPPIEVPDDQEGIYPGAYSPCDHCMITCFGGGSGSDCDECMQNKSALCGGECHINIACFYDYEGVPLTDGSLQYSWNINGPPATIKYYKDSGGSHEIRANAGGRIEIYPDWDEIEGSEDSHGTFVKEAEYEVTLTDGLGNVCKDKMTLKCTGCNNMPIDLTYNEITGMFEITTNASPPYYIQERKEGDSSWTTVMTTAEKIFSPSELCPCEETVYRASACPVDEEHTDFKTDSCDDDNEGVLIECVSIGTDYVNLIWNEDNPETIEPGTNIEINVTCCNLACFGPITWTLVGGGGEFTLEENGGESAILHASADACGSPLIKAEDKCGIVWNEIRCTAGTWYNWGFRAATGAGSCSGDVQCSREYAQVITGKWRLTWENSAAYNCCYPYEWSFTGYNGLPEGCPADSYCCEGCSPSPTCVRKGVYVEEWSCP